MFCDEFGGHATFIGKFCFVFGLWILQLTAITAADKSCAFTVGGACFHCSVMVAFYMARSLQLNQSAQGAGRNASHPLMKDRTFALFRPIGSYVTLLRHAKGLFYMTVGTKIKSFCSAL